MYKVIACDLDGTLLKDDKSISERTREALKRITDRGVIFLPSTGRTHRELPDALKDLDFLHYALCCNGGAVYDYAKDKYIYEDSIPFELAVEVLEYSKDLPVYETVVVNGERIVQGDQNDEIADYIKQVAVKGILFNFKGAFDVAEAFRLRKLNAQKILLYLDRGADKDSVISDLSLRFKDLSVSSSGPLFIEVNIKCVDKGKALRDFCELMNIPIEESMAFGDAENDISMLDAAGLSIVMENGTEKTKEHGDIICPSNNDDGVAEVIERYFP